MTRLQGQFASRAFDGDPYIEIMRVLPDKVSMLLLSNASNTTHRALMLLPFTCAGAVLVDSESHLGEKQDMQTLTALPRRACTQQVDDLPGSGDDMLACMRLCS